MEIINEISITCPYFTDLVYSLCRLNIDISLFSLFIGVPLLVPNTWFHNRDVVYPVGDVFHVVKREVFSIDRKSLEVMHVVDI